LTSVKDDVSGNGLQYGGEREYDEKSVQRRARSERENQDVTHFEDEKVRFGRWRQRWRCFLILCRRRGRASEQRLQPSTPSPVCSLLHFSASSSSAQILPFPFNQHRRRARGRYRIIDRVRSNARVGLLSMEGDLEPKVLGLVLPDFLKRRGNVGAFLEGEDRGERDAGKGYDSEKDEKRSRRRRNGRVRKGRYKGGGRVCVSRKRKQGSHRGKE
jgi:hypothetical protein